MDYEITMGEGRTQINLHAFHMGNDIVMRIFNKNAHIGAVALGEYDFEHQRASVSVMTRLGHKDDIIARKAAYAISKSARKAVCVIVGVHLENITQAEIDQILENGELVSKAFIKNMHEVMPQACF
jgi:hypothetical protein